MISKTNLDQQLQKIQFNTRGWGKSEARELCNVLMADEELDECVNGIYEAGFALLVATGDRLLLLDKKPLNYLVVEDLRFDMINEFDYGHRIIGAEIHVSTGMKTLHFRTWNQARLRRLYGFVQFRMTEVKRVQQSHQAAQKANLEQMNERLQLYLTLHQYQQQALHASSPAPIENTHNSYAAQHLSPGQLGVAAMKRVVPVISAYTRMPWMSQRYRPGLNW